MIIWKFSPNFVATFANSYQTIPHHLRKEVWTVVDGEGLLAIEGKITPVKQGDTVCILQDMRHGLKAINDLTLIETQTGSDLLEDDVELFDWNWQK